jgi:hypothetical protein
MVLPGDELTVDIPHTDMHDGNIVEIVTSNSRGEKMIEGSAEVAHPNTVYIFIGQGSQEQGMGTDLYNSSTAARKVWDGADTHLLAVYSWAGLVSALNESRIVHLATVFYALRRSLENCIVIKTCNPQAPHPFRHATSSHYSERAHRVLAEVSLAPKLLYIGSLVSIRINHRIILLRPQRLPCPSNFVLCACT